jgi:hypothetical protein
MAQDKIQDSDNEAASFLPAPDGDLGPVIDAAREYETELRRLFATDKGNPRLRDPHVGLVNVFKVPDDAKGARPIDRSDGAVNSEYVMSLDRDNTRRAKGDRCMVESVQEFQYNWSLFTENLFDAINDWDGFVVAGGSVLACLTPLAEDVKQSPTSIRDFYRSRYPVADIDLFLCGLNAQQVCLAIF